MRANDIAQLLQICINSSFPQDRLKGERIKKDVYIFGKPLDEVPAL